MVIHKAAPVQQLHHGLKAEDRLAGQVRVVRDHDRARLHLDWLVCFCPSKFLQPNLQEEHNSMAEISVYLSQHAADVGDTEFYIASSYRLSNSYMSLLMTRIMIVAEMR